MGVRYVVHGDALMRYGVHGDALMRYGVRNVMPGARQRVREPSSCHY